MRVRGEGRMRGRGRRLVEIGDVIGLMVCIFWGGRLQPEDSHGAAATCDNSLPSTTNNTILLTVVRVANRNGWERSFEVSVGAGSLADTIHLQLHTLAVLLITTLKLLNWLDACLLHTPADPSLVFRFLGLPLNHGVCSAQSVRRMRLPQRL